MPGRETTARRVTVRDLSKAAVPGWIQLGRAVVRVPYVWEPDRSTLALPAEVLDAFGFDRGQEVYALPADAGRRLVVGPLVGIWVTPAMLRSWKRGVRLLNQEARAAGGLPFFFDLEGVDRARGRIRGWTWQGGRLRPVTMPLPDVIYNRATFPDPGPRAAARSLRRALWEDDAIPFVNLASGFPKWETYQALRFFAATRPLVPETARLDAPAALAAFLSRHRLVFVKADGGSHGTEVVRLRAAGGGWWIEGQVGRQRLRTRAADPAQVAELLSRSVAGGVWVVQQGIQLPRVNGRRWDLRVEVKKDGTGTWTVPVIVVRLGNPATVTTNISRGGTPFELEAFRRRFGPLPALSGLKAKAIRVALRVAFALEARFGPLGEIGVDIGLDPQGRPWV
ncbi:MAG TPA: YheC/YheD family protein, partial [Thermaerobacter sp.]